MLSNRVVRVLLVLATLWVIHALPTTWQRRRPEPASAESTPSLGPVYGVVVAKTLMVVAMFSYLWVLEQQSPQVLYMRF